MQHEPFVWYLAIAMNVNQTDRRRETQIACILCHDRRSINHIVSGATLVLAERPPV